MIIIDVLVLRDRVRVTVVDPGSPAPPRVAERDFGEPGGLELRLVERLSNSWASRRTEAVSRASGRTHHGGGNAD